MNGFENKELCEWLENAVRMIMEKNAVSIGMVAQLPDGSVMTAYKNAGALKKIELAANMQMDAINDVIEANKGGRGDEE